MATGTGTTYCYLIYTTVVPQCRTCNHRRSRPTMPSMVSRRSSFARRHAQGVPVRSSVEQPYSCKDASEDSALAWPFLSYETFRPSSPPFVSYADRSRASVGDPPRCAWPFVSYESNHPSVKWPFVSYSYEDPTSTPTPCKDMSMSVANAWPFLSYDSFQPSTPPFISYSDSSRASVKEPSRHASHSKVSQTGSESAPTALVPAVPSARASGSAIDRSLPKALMWRHWLASVFNAMVCK